MEPEKKSEQAELDSQARIQAFLREEDGESESDAQYAARIQRATEALLRMHPKAHVTIMSPDGPTG